MTSETPEMRLGRLVRAQRKALKMTQADVQAAGGPSTATLRLIEGGKHSEFRDGTGADLERVLKWAPGSIGAILDGGEPTPLRGPSPLPPLAEVPPFRGTNSLRWRLAIEQKPEDLRTEVEAAWLAASDAERSRLAELAHRQGVNSLDEVVEDADWIPEDAPASRQPRWSSFRSRSFEEIFNEWMVARARLLNLELEYAIGRKIDPDDAANELVEVLQMVDDNRSGTGRPWTPPWDPGPEFRDGEEPWKAEWWRIVEQNVSGISKIGFSWDIEKVRKNREGDEQRAAEWEAHHQEELDKYHVAEARRVFSSRPDLALHDPEVSWSDFGLAAREEDDPKEDHPSE